MSKVSINSLPPSFPFSSLPPPPSVIRYQARCARPRPGLREQRERPGRTPEPHLPHPSLVCNSGGTEASEAGKASQSVAAAVKNSPDRWLITADVDFPESWEPASPRPRHGHIWCLLRALTPVHRQTPHCVLTGQRGRSSLRAPLQGIPPTTAPLSGLLPSPKSHH